MNDLKQVLRNRKNTSQGEESCLHFLKLNSLRY